MSRRQIYYYGNMSPFVVILLGILTLAAFFITLPIFLAALAVFACVAGYYMWQFNRALKRAEKELLEQQERAAAARAKEAEGRVIVEERHLIIDVTPDPEGKGPGTGGQGR
jgi:predicted membrane protein